MNKFNYSLLAAVLLTGTVVLSSCSSDELPVGNEVQQLATESAMTFSFSAPAVMGDEADTRVFNIGESSIDSRFDEKERVYVFIKSGNDLIYANKFLTPSDISADGKKCTFATDSLKFTLNSILSPETYTPVVGDVVYFYYGMNLASTDAEPYYSFATNGNKKFVEEKDYCLAEMVVKEVDTDNGKLVFAQKDDDTKRYFTFKNINSIFRQKVTIKDYWGNVITPKIKTLEIKSGNYVRSYFPFTNDGYNGYVFGPLLMELPVFDKNGNLYFTTSFNDLNKNDSLTFTANVGFNKYVATKGAPKGGFENNKYYYGDLELKFDLVFDSDILLPTITGMNETLISSDGRIEVYDYPANFTISGNAENVSIALKLKNDHNITFDNVDVKNGIPFISTDFVPEKLNYLTLNLKGKNTIMTKNSHAIQAIPSSGTYQTQLKLKCEGAEATLTIGIKDYDDNYLYARGLWFVNTQFPKNGGAPLDAEALKDIAAEGYMVECGARSYDYVSNTCFWTYTVKKM